MNDELLASIERLSALVGHYSRRRALPPVAPPLDPASHPGPVLGVALSEPFQQQRLLDRNVAPVKVGHGQRKQEDRPDLRQHPGLTEVREDHSDVHRIAAEPVRADRKAPAIWLASRMPAGRAGDGQTRSTPAPAR